MRTHLAFGILTVAIVSSLAGCGGGSSGVGTTFPPTPSPSPSVSPLLVAGTVAQYSGTDSIAYVYTSASQTNFTASYTFKETSTTNAAASGAPAPFDINNVTTFTTVAAPLKGTQKLSTTLNDYENQIASGSSLMIELVGSTSVTVGTDITSGAAGGGPYTLTSNDATTDTAPLNLGTYPLVSGAVYSEPLGKTTTNTSTDVNAGGSQPTTAFATQTNQTIANDSSFTRTQQLSNGEQSTTVETPSGTATLQESGPLFTFSQSIDAPSAGASGEVIPVTQSRQNVATGPTPAPSATPGNFSATDWYPGNAAPPSPLGQETLTVKGAATSLPSGCTGAISEPNTYELDEALTQLDVDGTYETVTQQRFLSNAITVCSLTTTVIQTYTVTTGALYSTSTETRAQMLTSLTPGSGTSAVRRKTP